MKPIIVLDSGPAGYITSPAKGRESVACAQWFQSVADAGREIALPEIVDYELRRELLRANKVKGLRALDALAARVRYLPITTAAMRQAAHFWAETRKKGLPTADEKSLDSDAILAAQAAALGSNVIVATTNVVHLSRFVPAELWGNIKP